MTLMNQIDWDLRKDHLPEAEEEAEVTPRIAPGKINRTSRLAEEMARAAKAAKAAQAARTAKAGKAGPGKAGKGAGKAAKVERSSKPAGVKVSAVQYRRSAGAESSAGKSAGLEAQASALGTFDRRAAQGGEKDRDPAREANSRGATTAGGKTVGDIASAGVSGASDRLPHLDRIQRAFGRHDVSRVQAALGSSASRANQAMGSEAYATGNRIAFRDASPSLHTVAHEAAHIIQQRAGVQLQGGVGEAGDRYEKQADEIADRVVQGRSVESLLDTVTAGFASRSSALLSDGPVQHKITTEAKTANEAADEEASGKDGEDRGTFDVDAAVKYNKGRGLSGTKWRKIQGIVGADVDGAPGRGTANAVYDWQKANDLSPDGKVGPGTLRTMAEKSGDKTLAAGGQQSSRDKKLAKVEEYNEFIVEAAEKYGMQVNHLKAIMAVESGGDPEASSGAAFGLMQITRSTWAGVQKSESDLAKYDFASYWRDPRINILFGAAVLKSKARSLGVAPDDENFAGLAVTAYNAGQGTVKRAMDLARKAGSKNPSADYIKPEYLKPAIEHYNLHSYYLTGKGKARNKSGTAREAIDLKYKEISSYTPKMVSYLSALEEGSGSSTASTSGTAPASTPAQTADQGTNAPRPAETPAPAGSAAPPSPADVPAPSGTAPAPAASGNEPEPGNGPAAEPSEPGKVLELDVDAAVKYNRSRPYGKKQWREIQTAVEAQPDGAPGPVTARAVHGWQGSHGVEADGKVGPTTLAAIQKATSAVDSEAVENSRVAEEQKAQSPAPEGAGADASAKADPGGTESREEQPVPEGNVTASFTWAEFQSRDGVAVPVELRDTVKALAEQLEVIRKHFNNAAITINSGYRSPAHNKKVGGAKNSYHMRGMAADIVVSGVSPSEVHKAVLQLIKDGQIRQGGVGKYNSFTHYDIRGSAARW